MLLTNMVERSIERTPTRVALVDIERNETYTYSELADRVYSIANTLSEYGIGKGDHVAIGMKTSIEHVTFNLALQYLGAVSVPFNFRVSKDSIRHHVSDSNAKLLAVDDALRDAVDDIQETLSCEEFVVAGENIPSYAHSFESLLESDAEKPSVEISPEDLSSILYTSGTTGQPKGVPIPHRSAVLRAIDTSMAQTSYLRGETTLSAMPLYHTIGLHSNCFARLCLSGTFIPMPEFDPTRYLEVLEHECVTAIFTAPTILNQLVNTDLVEEVDLRSVRVVGYGGEPISDHLVTEVQTHFDPEKLLNIYGTTETYHPLALTDSSNSGRNGTFYRRRIVELGSRDPTAEVDTLATGELIIHTDSPIVFDGYWENPEETNESVIDGWFFTGDAAHETADGQTVISGRADDTIISGGENIHPREVEDVLISHPEVADIGVVGVPDENWGEIVKAFVQPDGEVTSDELEMWCLGNESLDDFKRPRTYEFIEQLPRNPSGKVMRYKLREWE